MKIERNDPCPCRSGKKYKKCCLLLHERARAANTPLPIEEMNAYFAAVDEKSNHANDLSREGRFEEAEMICRQLITEHADQPDGLERLAEVYAAKGDRANAALTFRQAGLFHRVITPSNEGSAAWLFDQACRMDAGLDIEWPEGDFDDYVSKW